MKIINGIRTATGEKFLVVECNCGQTIRFPFDAEYLKCPDCGTLSSRKMLLEFYKNEKNIKEND